MIQLLEPNISVKKLLGEPVYNESVKYRFASFCLKIVKKETLIYNNLTREYLIISNLEYQQLEKSGYSLPKELVKELVSKWFLVPDSNDDYKISQQVKNFIKLFNNHNIVRNFNILPTTGCNARCFYCYQAGTKIKNMDDNTALDVAKYIIKKSDEKSVQICWFGGEPLCNMKAIDIISEYLNKKGKKFHSGITSNGYLFDEQTIKRAKEKWHLKKAQITLDGLSETYLKVKNYRNGDSNAFYKVLDNIGFLLKNNIRVEVRLNMDNHNYSELSALIDLLSERFSNYDDFLVYVRPIYENVGFEKIEHTEDSRAEITKKFIALREQIKQRNVFGKTNLMTTYRATSCQADDNTWRLILPDGKFAFCEHFLENDSFGSIYDDAPKPMWSEYCTAEEKCKTCPAYMDCVKNRRCPESPHGCYDYEQIMRVDRIYQGMEKEYANYLKQKTGK